MSDNMKTAIVIAAALLAIVYLGFSVRAQAEESPSPTFTAEEFKDLTGISLIDFLITKKQCEAATGERCRIFGGWAPESKFSDHKKDQEL